MRTVGAVLIVSLFVSGKCFAWPVARSAASRQASVFKQCWNKPFTWRFSELPVRATVPNDRVPYAGYIYPDNQGGCDVVLAKYDRAFHGGRTLAMSHEYADIANHQVPLGGGRFRRFNSVGTPYWAGHCNGWTAAAIRHAEPQRPVIRNGVTFRPADIKGLLAELYVYSQHELLAGSGQAVNAGLLHAILANWIGLNGHPVGMDKDPGHEVWNFPIYGYASKATQLQPHLVEVQTNLAYVDLLPEEQHRAPKNSKTLYFHYTLELNARGEIIGGEYIGDSNQLDMLWIPLQPCQGGTKGNWEGNPHLDVNTVLSMWRESVPDEIRERWVNIDPTAADRAVPFGKTDLMDLAARLQAKTKLTETAERGRASVNDAD